MNNHRINQRRQYAILLGLLFLVSGLLGYGVSTRYPELFTTMTRPEPVPSDVDWDKLGIIKDHIDNQYNGPVVDSTLLEGALRGMVNSLEGGGQFYNAREFSEILSRPDMVRGTGIHLGVQDDHLVVLRTDNNSQAQKSGILPGDKILKINGRIYTANEIETARNLMVSQARTSVDLSVLRGNDILEITVRLRLLTPQTVRALIHEDISVIRLPGFDEDPVRAFDEILKGQIRQGAKALVLDLRDLPSGKITEAVSLASRFIPSGETVMAIRDTKGKIREFKSTDGSLAAFPLVVLINERTEGTGEFVAGSLRQKANALLIGEQTMGEGRIYSYIELPEGEGIKLVTGYFTLPGNHEIHGRGIQPAVVVPGDLRYAPNLIRPNDLQMRRALEEAAKLIGR